MRLRVRRSLGSADVPPPELLVGRCVEVWASSGDPNPAFSAWRRHTAATWSWAAERSLSTAERCRLIPAGAPWSAQFLLREGCGDYVDERFARAGVTVDDVPRLRAAAGARAS